MIIDMNKMNTYIIFVTFFAEKPTLGLNFQVPIDGAHAIMKGISIQWAKINISNFPYDFRNRNVSNKHLICNHGKLQIIIL